MMHQRWKRLSESLYSPKTQLFDTTKIPDVEDYVKFDALHNRGIIGEHLIIPLFDKAKSLADFVVPREYGIMPEDKMRIGRKIGSPLFAAIKDNIDDICKETPDSRVHFHFTSESHVHPLVNVLLHDERAEMLTPKYYREMNYLTQVIIKVYEDTAAEPGSAERFRIQLFLSGGAISDALAITPEEQQILPILPALCLNKNLSKAEIEAILHTE